MGLVDFAEREMKLAGLYGEDAPYGGMFPEAVLKLVRTFADEGHSGMSAGICVSILEKLLRYEPLTPLTGEESEWTEVCPGEFQNNRCFRVFKDAAGNAYDSEGRVFREPSGACFISFESRVPVTFPYAPKREYVDVPEPERVDS